MAVAPKISVSLPLQYGDKDGPYEMLDNLRDVVRQHFKNLILTIPGERVMIPDFGIGVHQYLFEQPSPQILDEIRSKIQQKTRKYIPSIALSNIFLNFDESTSSLLIKIEYFIAKLNAADTLELSVSAPL